MKVACHLGLGHYKEALDITEIVLKSKPGDLSGGLYKAYTEKRWECPKRQLRPSIDVLKTTQTIRTVEE